MACKVWMKLHDAWLGLPLQALCLLEALFPSSLGLPIYLGKKLTKCSFILKSPSGYFVQIRTTCYIVSQVYKHPSRFLLQIQF